MRKLLSLVLVLMLALALVSVPASAEGVTVTMFQLKVEIDSALQAFAAKYNETHPGVTVKVETLGGGADYGGALRAKLQGGQMPDIFVIEGQGGYDIWKDYAADLSDQPWVADTDLGFTQDGKVFGFPVAIEGYGLGYNKDILDKAGIDPASITSYSKMKEAFEKLDSMADELGLDAVVSMGASISGGLWWCGQHNVCAYLGGGLDYNDRTIIDKTLNGEVDAERLADYANYVKLIYDFSDPAILTAGSYDDQVASFAQGKTAFIHQGNWIDPNMKQMEVTFPMGYVPHAFSDKQEFTGLFLFAPSWYLVNEQSPNAQAAKDFLTYMATTPEGADYMVNQAGMVPAFKSVTLEPTGGFSKALVEANAKGGNYAVRFGELPDGYTQNTLAPAFDLFAQDPTQLDAFIADLTAAIETLKE